MGSLQKTAGLWFALTLVGAILPGAGALADLQSDVGISDSGISDSGVAVDATVEAVAPPPPETPPPLEPLTPQSLETEPSVQPDITVPTAHGPVGGEALVDGTFAFRAVPFARPPVGDLRWKAPLDPLAWNRPVFSLQSAPACLQVSYGWNETDAVSSSEDCLYLEVRTPSLDAGANLPVMVYIHGGANRAGSGSGTIASALPPQGVVLVSVQYRLGVFGFMSHPALTQEGGGSSGNYALMDQVKALEWVRDNIAQFGGNPENVTLFGHSAGSQDVGLLMVSPLARGLFHKAILQSGPPSFGVRARSLAENEAIGLDLARTFAITRPDAPESAQALSDLRRVPPALLQRAADKIQPPTDDKSFIWLQPTVDGRVLPVAPDTAFATGQVARLPVIMGFSAQELDLDGGMTATYPTLQKRFAERERRRVLAFYRLDRDVSPRVDEVLGTVSMQISTDLMMRCPVRKLGEQMTSLGAPVWMYQLSVDKAGKIRHGSELPFVFDLPPAGTTEGDWPPLGAYWVQFAKAGNPNRPGLTPWAVYGEAGHYADFTARGLRTERNLRGVVCERLLAP